MMHPTICLFIICATLTSYLTTATPTATAGVAIELEPGQRQLFLDNYAVDRMQNLNRTMHKPIKKGAVVKPDIPSDGIRVQARSAPVWDPKAEQYKLFYMAFPMENHQLIGSALAISKDGVNWIKPSLNQVEIYGTKANNRFDVDPSLSWTSNKFMDVIYATASQPEQPFKGLLGAIGRKPVLSANGVQWQKSNGPTIPSSDESFLIYDEQGQRYIAVVKTGTEWGRSQAVAFSKDFTNWTKPRLMFTADQEDQRIAQRRIRQRLDDPGLVAPMFNDPDPATGWKPPKEPRHLPTWRAEIYGCAVFPYEGVYMAMPMMYYITGQRIPERNNTVGFNEIHLAFTRDPQLSHENWQRLGNREPFIATSRLDDGLLGNFDRLQIAPTCRPVVMGDELWFYYVGFKSRIQLYERNADGSMRDPATLSEEEKADLKDGWSAICLAVLRRDGFVSLDAGETTGTLLTKKFKATGDGLYINAAAHTDGEIVVEVLDETGEPIIGFDRSSALSMAGDGVKQQVAWNSGMYWAQLEGMTVSLRITARNANLYAFWVE